MKEEKETADSLNSISSAEWSVVTKPSPLIAGRYGSLVFEAVIKKNRPSLRLADHLPACCEHHSGPGSPGIWWGKGQSSHLEAEGYVSASLTRKNQHIPVKVVVDEGGRAIELFVENGHFLEGDCVWVIWGDTQKGGKGIITPQLATIYEFCTSLPRTRSWPWGLTTRDRLQVQVVGGSVVRLHAVTPSIVEKATSFLLKVRSLDEWGNLASDAPAVSVVADSKVSACKQVGSGVFQVVVDEVGFHRIAVTDGTRRMFCNPFYVTRDKPTHQIYFGDLHGHTRCSDGLWDAVASLEYARDVALWDMAALADHDDGSHGSEGPKSRFPEESWREIQYAWVSTQRPGAFLVLPAVEWSAGRTRTKNSAGDKNIYWYDPKKARPIHAATVEELWDEVADDRALVISHHTAYGSEESTWWGYCACSPSDHNPKFQPLVEIYSRHGSSESADSPYPLKTQAPGHFVRDLLAKGWRVGFIASSDIHSGPVGSLYKNFFSFLPHPGGVAAVYAGSLTRESILDGMAERRTYGTTNVRMFLDFYINGYPMGSEIQVSEPSVDIVLRAAGTDELKSVEIWKYNHLGWRPFLSLNPRNWWIKKGISERLDGPTIYYMRVIQVDGNVGWASPVWVDLQ